MRSDDAAVAVYAKDEDLLLIDLLRDGRQALRDAAASAKGYLRCGYFTTTNGVPSVQCEPGVRAALAMMRAGITYARLLCAPSGQEN